MPTQPALTSLLADARAWAADDPDGQTRAELEAVIGAAEGGDEAARADLADRFSGLLEFGTAGLRGALGAGPNRMNRAVVIRAAAGLTAYLKSSVERPFVVIGYDARINSDVFARDTAAVVVGAGGRAAILPRPMPTPVLAHAIRALGADAGVMVTASHNPPQDNGYKVYVGDGSQIVSPVDGLIAAEIETVRAVADVPRADSGWQDLDDAVLDAYVADAATVVSPEAPGTWWSCIRPCTAWGPRPFAKRSRLRASMSPFPLRHKPNPTHSSRLSPSPTRRSPGRWTWRWSWPSRPDPIW